MERMLGGCRLRLIQGDITTLATDAIVNAANADLVLGAGVAGAICRRGGPTIQEECRRIGGCPVGGAVVTTGGQLPARFVIHAVGPRYGEGDEERKLVAATRAALRRAEEHHLRSLALPAIPTGIFGFPVERAATLMLTTVIAELTAGTGLQEVVFCLFSREHLEIFSRELEHLTPATRG